MVTCKEIDIFVLLGPVSQSERCATSIYLHDNIIPTAMVTLRAYCETVPVSCYHGGRTDMASGESESKTYLTPMRVAINMEQMGSAIIQPK